MKGLTIQITGSFNNINIDQARLKKLINAICRRFTNPLEPKIKYEISVAIVDNDQMRKLNRKFLKQDSITDVISFDLSEKKPKSEIRNRKSKIENRKFLEVVVNAQKAADEAKRRGHSTQAELALYITHGLLHNFGFDDTGQNRAKKMHREEDQILKQQGFGAVFEH